MTGLVQLQYVQPRGAVLIAISAATFVMLVAAAAESLVACAGEHDHAHGGGTAAIVHSVEHLGVCLRAESIVHFRSVDGDAGNAVIEIKKDVGVIFDLSPVSHFL